MPALVEDFPGFVLLGRRRMQQVERRDVARNGLSPVKGFAIVAALALAGGAFLLLTKNGSDPTQSDPPTNQPPTTLTNAEALDRFEFLNDSLVRAVRRQDPSLLRGAVLFGSPVYERAIESIKELQTQDVTDQSHLTTVSLDVQTNENERIRLLEVNRLDPCFVSNVGKDVTERHVVTRQEIAWTMVFGESAWLISDAEVLKQQVLEDTSADCP
jgi:hypothetical protein